ncbi:M48 family metallopeptidase [Oxalicibacterium faecigallinarum]|uniref:Zn-dependent protease n=1 Tax=Oxalicibacterium faecigallinarum TaxID=573741 RepID=A0A8J3AXW4_9BURK|nr:M48 family metallopeptidase [Oxalicibacterium faecigallinarum]GGI18824.1 Zn-dependent protease [Oxalicibacterium faecigallinarum]
MKFFEQQDEARRQTKKLVILFVLAVIAIVIAVNVAMALLWNGLQTYAGGQFYATPYPPAFFLTNTLVTLLLIIGGTLIEMFRLRDGGDAVARMAGGRLVATDTSDTRERRLINVVEEMALASGIACPKVYVLDREQSINAFAAGYNLNEAVIAVTRGTLDRLSRDELQGVVAHEYSHILNGDMRLNVRLIGVLFGIQMVAGFGQQMMGIGARASMISAPRRRDNNNGVPIQLFIVGAGAILFVIGYIGIFFGRLIKSAVSRQREFLADASAVQFTRNPDGIGNALRKIGGLTKKGGEEARILHGNAEQLSHLFLSAVRPSLLDGLFATHPSLQERLRRIYGRDMTLMDAPVIAQPALPPAERLPDLPFVASGFAEVQAARQQAVADIAATAALTSAPFGTDQEKAPVLSPLEQIRRMPDIDRAVHDPYAAVSLVLALFMESDAMQSEEKTIFVRTHLPRQAEQIVAMAAAIRQLPRNARLPLLDIAMPALRRLPVNAHMDMLDNISRLINSDQCVTLHEFVLQTVLERRLDARANRAVPVRFHDLHALRQECLKLFSLVAHVMAKLEKLPAEQTFARIVAQAPFALTPADLQPVSALSYQEIKQVLDRVNQLAPLSKPALIKALLNVSGSQSLPLTMADLLRAICAALEAPMPAAVARIYTEAGWPEA